MSSQLHLIWAQARGRVIGRDNTLPWHLPEDLAHFKRTTLGAPVIMGRKTWDSLPARFRPLPGRLNIVVTRQTDWRAEGAQRAGSVAAAREAAGDAPVAWIIGGAELYARALPHAHRAVITEIELDCEGDAHAPALGPSWIESARETHVSAQGLRYSFVTYDNTQPV